MKFFVALYNNFFIILYYEIKTLKLEIELFFASFLYFLLFNCAFNNGDIFFKFRIITHNHLQRAKRTKIIS